MFHSISLLRGLQVAVVCGAAGFSYSVATSRSLPAPMMAEVRAIGTNPPQSPPIIPVGIPDAVLPRPFLKQIPSGIAADGTGNIYITGSGTGVDFNPFVGKDIRADGSGFVTRFNADGTYGWTQTLAAGGAGLVVGNGVVFVVGTLDANACVWALDAATGAPKPGWGFNGTGVQTFGGNGFTNYVGDTFDNDAGRAIAASPDGSTVYVAGTFYGASARVGGTGPVVPTSGGANYDAFVMALDAATGAPRAGFGVNGSGVQTFGGSANVYAGTSSEEGTVIATYGNTVYVGGQFGTTNAGIGGIGPITAANAYGFILALDATTGVGRAGFGTGGVITRPRAVTALAAASDGGALYACVDADYDSTLHCLDLSTGAPKAGFGRDGVLNVGYADHVLLVGQTLYVTCLGGGAELPFDGTWLTVSPNGADVYADAVVCLDAATGARKTTFAQDGVQTFPNGAYSSRRDIAAVGNTIYAVGDFYLGRHVEPLLLDSCGMLLAMDATTGVLGTDSALTTVTNTNDSGWGSLRTALLLARNGSVVRFDPNVFDMNNADLATVINVRGSALPALEGGVTIDAQDRRVTINASAATTESRAYGLSIPTNDNTVLGLTIVGAPQWGISINTGAKNNVIGGNRNVGLGPNGQGLRISNCGGVGAEITEGASNNVIKGCWIGLDSSGMAAQSNLGGMLISQSANNNAIGGAVYGEANVISGNTYEGIAVSDAGTDGNVIVGNIIGASAVVASSRSVSAAARADDTFTLPSRSPLGNGSAGIFLSRGTKKSRVGGEAPGEGNVIVHNGGTGIEVRTPDAKENTVRSNSITKNLRGGIALYDNSNAGIKPPRFDAVALPSRAASRTAAGRAVVTATISGSADSDGTVEVFLDSGTQGERLVGRAACTGGKWGLEVDVDDVMNLTATLTDANGNTSAFAVFGRADGSGIGGVQPTDADGDGISDTLEALAGSNPGSNSDVPAVGGAVVVDKAAISLNFASQTKDSLKTTMRLTVPSGYKHDGTGVNILFGEGIERFVLDPKGKQSRGTAAVNVKTSKTGAGATVQFSVKGKDLKTGLASSRLVDKTTDKMGERLTIPVAVAIATTDGKKYVYIGSVDVLYKAVQGKTGKAAKAK